MTRLSIVQMREPLSLGISRAVTLSGWGSKMLSEQFQSGKPGAITVQVSIVEDVRIIQCSGDPELCGTCWMIRISIIQLNSSESLSD
jgi:hypothetical protein